MPYLWIIVTVVATAFQVARNATQRGMMGEAGPWGATLVRFLFGLPFSLAITGAAWLAAGAVHPRPSWAYAGFALSGAATQALATACLLVVMRRAGFAVGTLLQQSSLPMSAVIGLVLFHDHLSGRGWAGVAAATAGLVWLTWPRSGGPVERPFSTAGLGLVIGALFGFSLNAYRHAALALEPAHPVFAAVATVCVAQAAQTVTLVLYLALRHPWALQAIFLEVLMMRAEPWKRASLPT